MLSDKVLEALAVTAEICGHDLSRGAALVMGAELENYPAEAVLRSLARCRKELTGRLSLAAIIARIETGHPGAEEAWAMVPKNEADSAVLTQQILNAMGVAMPLYDDGDKIGARMAFKETYERELQGAGTPVWVASLGHDPKGREPVLLDAVAKGRLTSQRAATLGLRHDSGVNAIAANLASALTWKH